MTYKYKVKDILFGISTKLYGHGLTKSGTVYDRYNCYGFSKEIDIVLFIFQLSQSDILQKDTLVIMTETKVPRYKKMWYECQ